MQPQENILPFDGEAYYHSHFFTTKESEKLFNVLKEEIQWRHEPIILFGKRILQPRLTALYGNPKVPYGYSGIQMIPFPLTEALLIIKNKIEIFTSHNFTHVLLNYYRDGQDSMGWHRDNEKILGPEPVIASVSFGVSRVFHLRSYRDKKLKIEQNLENGSLLIMKGKSQECWEHQIPKSKKVIGERINLTFRKLSI